MVKLHASLLALTFVTGSVLASSDKYERRDLHNVRIGTVMHTAPFQSRGFDDDQDRFERDLEIEEFSGREYLLDTFDDLEARQPSLFGTLSHLGETAVKDLAKSKLPKVAAEAAGPGKYNKAFKAATTVAKIGRKAKSGKIGGKLESKLSRKVADKLGHTKLGRKVDSKVRRKMTAKVASKIRRTAVKQVKDQVKQAGSSSSSSNQQQSNNNNKAQQRANKYVQEGRKDIAQANRYLPANLQVHLQSRALEDDKDLSRRNLDAEELFVRDYDFLDERGTFDDLD
jgi:hypothetical protein